MKAWSHDAVVVLHFLVVSALAAFVWGAMNGVLAWPEFWDISTSTVPFGYPRTAVHLPVSLAYIYVLICWLGAAKGSSPSRTLATVIVAPVMTLLLHWSYGSGVLKAWWRIYISKKPGLQVDDKNRS